jgi:Na+-translocating ferredoxin:NAD+ oxidoreductase RNF subunit RnfB
MTGIPILDSALILGGVGLFFGFVISLVNKKFRVWEDPRILGVEELLPSTNCGACSQPGCRAFAEAVVAGSQQPSDCTVMGPEDVEDVAGYLGVDAGEANKRVARLLCAGGKDEAHRKADYSGFGTCKAAAAVAGGGKGCTWGCLGLADCEVVCLLDAIYMNEDELPVVIP